ncbi:PepSY-associated TM helix domain-containing protein [Solicola sp. PLA-1-18]|uniref:PepSY-associated TM helix domain-containing protein n=1 Tax=Solicola sp. PLA-1-18 TaxID=3380532 RepID=UPI003B7F9CAE
MTTTDPATTLETDDLDRPPTRRASLRPLLTRLHFYAGIFVGPFIVVAALSGLLYAVSPQIEQVVHADQVGTDSRGPERTLAEQVDAARAVRPDLPLLAVRPAAEPGQTTRVLFDGGRTADSERQAMFVDPVTAETQGELTVYGSSGSLPTRTWISNLHRSLHLGDVGRLYSELAASWLWVVAVVGVALWWTGRRRGSRLRPYRDGGPRRRTLSWHGATGTWIVLGMLMLSATGLTWSQHAGANVTELRTALSWSTPAVTSDLATGTGDTGEHEGHSDHGGGASETAPVGDEPGVGFDAARQAATVEGLSGPLEITAPTSATGTYVVAELDKHWPTRADAVSIDPADGSVVDVVRFADYPFAAKLARWGIDLHMGLLFGVWNQVALVLLAGAITAMTVWGYRMWWLRRPTRGPRLRAGRPARRGAWRQAPTPALVVAAVLALIAGWFMPVLGVSLLGFLVVDAVVGLQRRRRTA